MKNISFRVSKIFLKNVNKYIFEEINAFVRGCIQSKSDIFHIVTM